MRMIFLLIQITFNLIGCAVLKIGSVFIGTLSLLQKKKNTKREKILNEIKNQKIGP